MESGGEDEVQMIGEGGQLVPVASDGSPTKRPRQVDSLANHDIVHLIQQTISTSLEGYLGRIQDSLTNIVHDQASQSSRLKKLEDQASKQQLTLGEIQQSHSQRMDTLQAEIVQLQKHSAPTSPHASPTHSPLAYRAAGPMEDPSFDLVLGGWKEGRSRGKHFNSDQHSAQRSQLVDRGIGTQVVWQTPHYRKGCPQVPGGDDYARKEGSATLLEGLCS